MKQTLFVICNTLFLYTYCTTHLIRTDQHNAVVQPKYIIIHYTVSCDTEKTVQFFNNPATSVSIHYIIGPNGQTKMMIDPKYLAEHAGVSAWQGCTDINAYSIGIELINPGSTENNQSPCSQSNSKWTMQDCHITQGSNKCWYPFPKKQIASLIKLCKHLTKQFNIKRANILGHSDIAPGRKTDPGPLFPWSHLAKHNLGIWPSIIKPYNSINIDQAKNNLRLIGYLVDTNDNAIDFKNVIQAFQIHFRQNKIDGILDQETYDLITSIADICQSEIK